MHYAQIRKYDTANGVGIRASLFVSGCTHKCPGCFNEEYKQFNYGIKWTAQIEEQFIEHIKNSYVQGITIIGGEPFQQDEDLPALLAHIKEETNTNIWIYSGYTYEEIIKNAHQSLILSYCDVLVDGKFIEKYKDIRLSFRGSSNQRLIDVQESIKNNYVVLYDYQNNSSIAN
ncbi:MAG: anaerobic ribonucleoside-triphosphate reductase activating protein [Epulopiscium sp. Nele67-Bin005]|nr:MAG: anaerobic ribonucleoside-triphosphate reductase activating protein [Epulopiscium sp. Nele67-Bin005]